MPDEEIEKRVLIEGVRVRSDGTFTIPDNIRDAHDIEEGDEVNLLVSLDNDSFRADDRSVLSRHRVVVPKKDRDSYDIERGDPVDVYLELKHD